MAEKIDSGIARAATVRHGKLRRSSAWGNAARVLLTALIVIVLGGAATAGYAVWNIASNLNTVDIFDSETGEVIKAGDASIDGELTILLVGSDTREGQDYDDGETGELNDVNLLLHVSADHQNATVVSFPRDLMIPIPSCPGPNGEPNYYSAMSSQQLNTALSYGGLPCVAMTIENLTGMKVPYAGLVTFNGVVGISNAIGGVNVCLTQPIVDPDTGLDLPAGDVELEGWDALQFLRTRHGVGDGGDLSRINNQQVFMSALMKQLKSKDTLSDPVKVYALAKAGVENTQLSSNMASIEFLQALAGTVKDIDLDHINFVQYPSATHPVAAGRLVPDWANAELLIDVIESGQPFKVTGVGTGVEVEGSDDPASGDGAADGGADDPAVSENPAATEDPADPASGGEQVDPASQEPADPTAEPSADPNTGENAGGDETSSGGKVELPDSITGLGGDSVACSQGRTIF